MSAAHAATIAWRHILVSWLGAVGALGQRADLRFAVAMRYPIGEVGASAGGYLFRTDRQRAKVLDDPRPAVQAGRVEQPMLRVGFG